MTKQWKLWKTKYQWAPDRVESLISDLQDFMFKAENIEAQDMTDTPNFEIIDKSLQLYHSWDADKLKTKFDSFPPKQRKKINKGFWKLKKWINKDKSVEKKMKKAIKHLTKIHTRIKEGEKAAMKK